MQQCLNRCSDMVDDKDRRPVGSIISNVHQSTWDDAKDVDRARYGGEGKHSRRFASYEHIPLPVRIKNYC